MKRIISIVLVLSLILISGCKGSGGESLDELMALGQKYLLEENYKEAIIAFEKVIQLDEKYVEAYIGLADAYVGAGDIDKAIEILDKGYGLTNDEVLNQKKQEMEHIKKPAIDSAVEPAAISDTGQEEPDVNAEEPPAVPETKQYVYYHYVQMYDDMSFKIGYEEGGNYSYYHEIILDEPLNQVESPYSEEGHPTFGYYMCIEENNGFKDGSDLWYKK